MRVVLDCNVVISAGLGTGLPHKVLAALTEGHQLLLSPAILQEYQDVAARPKFAKYATRLHQLIESISTAAILVEDSPSPYRLPDIDDEPYLAVALQAEALYLVTGNLKHFPDSPYGTVRVLSVRSMAERLSLA